MHRIAAAAGITSLETMGSHTIGFGSNSGMLTAWITASAALTGIRSFFYQIGPE